MSTVLTHCREIAAESVYKERCITVDHEDSWTKYMSIYKERCITVDNEDSWTKYMSISGSAEDDHNIIALQSR